MAGGPIRGSPDRRLHAPTRGFSQLVTPFFGARAEPSTRRLSVPGVLRAQLWFAQSRAPFPPSTSGDWEWRAKRLGRSLGAYTPTPSTGSSTPALVHDRGPSPGPLSRSGRLVSGGASGLDAFSPYPRRRGCPAMPCRTTGRLEAAPPRSSRTKGSFPSGGQRPQQIESDLSRDGLIPAHVPL